MAEFKSKIYEVCNEVAAEFEGWSFVSGKFVNNSTDFAELVIDLGFRFHNNATPLFPALLVRHRISENIFKALIGYEQPTSIIKFQSIAQMLKYIPENLRLVCWVADDEEFKAVRELSIGKKDADNIISVANIHDILRAVIRDGIAIFYALYNFSSEKDFLSNLPPKYTTRHPNTVYDEFEKSKGIMICIVRSIIGDCEFVKKYRSDECKTIYPKRIKEVDMVINGCETIKKFQKRL